MDKELRKVKFTLERIRATIGDLESGGENAEEIMKERIGFFYGFGNFPFFDDEHCLHDQCMGIVEEKSTGKVYNVLPEKIQFINE